MGAQYYGADSENGDRIDDPSEDALFMLISGLNDSDNTFVVVQPDEDAPVWFASVAVLDEGGYEIVRRDTTRNEHEVTTATDINGHRSRPHHLRWPPATSPDDPPSTPATSKPAARHPHPRRHVACQTGQPPPALRVTDWAT
ncbi:hypothetical protein Shyd_16610 [Streptomyces hydrogenans]|uniref:Uncharacterized protein n=1 Tax=Streptomyces hydrogenans TaxID=1873719 RepID=A0ABQ3P5J8_9ACTN|nr:hypothetical protein Shyd_16610 [Streptomyces hydrogenans]